MIIAIDFDGTIVENEFPEIGPPVAGALMWILRFVDAGAEILLWTARQEGGRHCNALSLALEYLRDEHIMATHWAGSKPPADVFIDDLAFGCPTVPGQNGRPEVDWSKVGPGVMAMIESGEYSTRRLR